MQKKSLTCAMLITFLLFSVAYALTIADLSDWETAYCNDEPLRLSLSGTLDAYTGGKEELDVLNSLIRDFTLQLTIKGEEQALSLLKNDAVEFSLAGKIVNKANINALRVLRDVFTNEMPKLYTHLSKYDVVDLKKSNNIKNVGGAPRQKVYTLSSQEANLLFDTLREPVTAQAKLLWEDAPYGTSILQYIEHMVFVDKVIVKQFISKEDENLGLQITTKFTNDGKDRRSLTIYGGYKQGHGAYLSFSVPSSKNTLKTVLSYTVKEKNNNKYYDLNLLTTRKFDGNFSTYEKDVIFQEKEDGITATIETLAKEKGVARETIVDIVATGDQEALNADIAVAMKTNNVSTASFTVQALLEKGSIFDFVNAKNVVNLLDGDAESKEKQLETIAQQLLYLFFTTAMETTTTQEISFDLYGFLHSMATDTWFNGPSVSPLPLDFQMQN